MKSRIAFFSLQLAVMCLLLSLGVNAADWPMLRGDAMRSGIADEMLSATQLQAAWSTWVGGSVDASPAVTAGRVYAGNAAGEVICLNAADGAIIWRTRTNGAVVSSPAVDEDIVFVGSADRCLYALDALTGRFLWRVRTWLPVVASPLIVNHCIYIGSMDGSFRCIGADGRALWQKDAGPVSGSAAAFGEAVYYGDEQGNIFARNSNDGKLIWTAMVAGSVIRAPIVTEKYAIFGVMSPSALQAPNIDYIVVYNRTSGQKMWAHKGQHSVMHTAIADAGRLYYATVSGYTSTSTLFCCQLDDGKELWKKNLAGVADSSPVIIGEHVLLGVHDGLLHVYAKTDGTEEHTVHVGAKIYSTPAVADGAVYFGAGDGLVRCLRPVTTP